MTKRIVALVFAAAATVGLAAAPAQAALAKPAASQSAVSGWEWGSVKAPASQSAASGWEWGSVKAPASQGSVSGWEWGSVR